MSTVVTRTNQADLSLAHLRVPTAEHELPSINILLSAAARSTCEHTSRELFEKAIPALYNLCAAVLVRAYPGISGFDREALIQDSVSKVWSGFSTFNPAKSASTWVARIAYNTAADFVRKQSHPVTPRSNMLDRVIAKGLADERSGSGEREFLERDHRDRFFESLPAGLRQMALLREEGHTYLDISEREVISLSTVKSRMRRIRELLEARCD